MNLKSGKFAILVGMMAVCTTEAIAQESFVLEIKADKPLAEYKAFLKYKKGAENRLDSVASFKGKGVIKGIVAAPQRASIYLLPAEKCAGDIPRGGGIPVYLESGKAQIEVGESLTEIKLQGTPLNDDLQAFNAMKKVHNQKGEALKAAYKAASEKEDAAAQNTISASYDRWEEDAAQAEEDFFLTHLDTQVSLDWLRRSFNLKRNKSKVKTFFAKLSDQVKDSEAGRSYHAMIQETVSVEIGDMAPDFICQNMKGEDVSLSSFRGKYLLLDFWASWCGPCRHENPNVVKAYNAYHAANFTVLGVSLDNKKELWEKAIEKDGLTWTNVSDLKGWNCAPAALYSVNGIPSNFLIDPSGKIIALNLRGENLDNKLKELLK